MKWRRAARQSRGEVCVSYRHCAHTDLHSLVKTKHFGHAETSLAVGTAKLPWRHPGEPPERVAHLALIAEAGLQRQFSQRKLRRREELADPLDPAAPQILAGRAGVILAECARQMNRMHLGLMGDLADGHLRRAATPNGMTDLGEHAW